MANTDDSNNPVEESEYEPLLVEITPPMAADLIVILEHMPSLNEDLDESLIQSAVAMTISYMRTRLESGDCQFLDGAQFGADRVRV